MLNQFAAVFGLGFEVQGTLIFGVKLNKQLTVKLSNESDRLIQTMFYLTKD